MTKKTERKKRRGQGEGAIFQRSNGRWCAEVTIDYEGGKQNRKTVYGKTRGEVQAKLMKLQSDIEKGLFIKNDKLTVEQFLTDWLSEIKPTVKARTYRFYADHTRLHIIPILGSKKLAKLTLADIQKLITAIMEKGLSAQSVKHIIGTLRIALNNALKHEYVYRNVGAIATLPRIQKKEMSVYSPEQINIFFDFIKGHRLEALFVMAFMLGLRKGEVLGLRWQDVDLDSASVQVNYALQRYDGELHLTEPKTEKSRRLLPLPSRLVAALRNHRTMQLEERMKLGSDWQNDRDLVFVSNIGTPLEPRNVNRTFDALIKNLNKSLEESGKERLPLIRFHDTRHCAATTLVAQGVELRVVMEILGHSEIRLTADRYTHILKDTKRDAMRKIDSVFG